MGDQDEVDKNLPPAPDGEDSVDDEEDPEEDDGSRVIEEEDEEGGDYYLHRIDRLLRADERDELPGLYVDHLFSARAVIAQSGLPVSLDKKNFGIRLRSFLEQEDPDFIDVPPSISRFPVRPGCSRT